jgi:hypothetical protein
MSRSVHRLVDQLQLAFASINQIAPKKEFSLHAAASTNKIN